MYSNPSKRIGRRIGATTGIGRPVVDFWGGVVLGHVVTTVMVVVAAAAAVPAVVSRL